MDKAKEEIIRNRYRSLYDNELAKEFIYET